MSTITVGVSGDFQTIQAAINAASAGDTIVVAAGVYVEQLNVENLDNLTIRAEDGAEVTIQAPADVVESARSSSDREVHAVISVENSENVQIVGVNVDGAGAANTIDEGGGAGQAQYVGVFYRNASGGLTDVDVTGVRDPYPGGLTPDGNPVVSGNQRGVGVQVDNDTLMDFAMTGGSITDFQKNATVFSRANLDVTGVTVIGGGDQTVNTQNGFQATLSTGRISGNTVSDIGYAGPQTLYSGLIMAYGNTNLEISGNTLTGANETNPDARAVGVFVLDFGVPADGGSVINNTISHVDTGVDVSGGFINPVEVSGNSVTDMDEADAYAGGVWLYPNSALDVDFNVTGSETFDFLTGAAGDDTLDGAGGADTIDGGDGDDVIIYGEGDTIDGGDGNDTVVVDDDAEAALFAASGATGVEIVTDGDGVFYVSDGMSLQAAIDAAEAGDTIMVAAGTYNENLTLSKGLTFVAVGGDVTVASVAGDTPALRITGDHGDADTSFTGFTFTGTTGLNLTLASGVYVDATNVGELTLDDCTVTSNAGSGFFAYYADIDQLNITNSDFGKNAGNGSNSGANIKLFGFTGDALLQNIDIAGAADGTVQTSRPDFGIEFHGAENLFLTGDPSLLPPMGTVVIDGVTISGEFHKTPFAVNNYLNLDGLTIDGLDLSGAEAFWGAAGAASYLFNMDGISDDIDVSGYGVTFNDSWPVAADIHGEHSTQADFGQSIVGTGGVDRLAGNDGDDTIEGGAGGDLMDGGAGSDTISYAGSSDAVEVDLGHGGSASGGDADGDIFTSFENATGSAHDDSLDGSNFDNVLDGGAGDDIIDGAGGNDVILGGDGEDILLGRAGDDVIVGGEGDDVIDAGAGDDVIDATQGDDIVNGGKGFDVVYLADEATADAFTGKNIEVVAFDNGDGTTTFRVSAGSDLQRIIDLADDGDTIELADGVYAGGLVIDKSLTITGSDDAVIQGNFREINSITGSTADFFKTATAYSQTGNGIVVNADGVTLDGITVRNFSTNITIEDGVDGLTLNDVTLMDAVQGIHKGEVADVTNLTINSGLFTEMYFGVIGYKGPTDGDGHLVGLVIDGSTFEHLTQKGVYLETLKDGHLTNITMTDVGQWGGGPAFGANGRNGAGIELNFKYEQGFYDNIVIENFDLTDVGLSDGLGTPHNNAGAITIKVRDDAPSYSGNPADFLGTVIIRDGSIDGTSVGIRQGEGGKVVGGPSLDISGVTITDAVVGDVENLTSAPMTVELSAGDDTLTVSPNSTGQITIDGMDGADTITGGGGKETLNGGAGDDDLDGGAGADAINGGDGADTLSGGDGDDAIDGGLGDDAIDGGAGDDIIDATQGTDTIDGGDGLDHVHVADEAAARSITADNVELISFEDGGQRTFVVRDGMSIQDAIDAASAGDTIIVEAGTYAENLTISTDGLNIVADTGAVLQGSLMADNGITGSLVDHMNTNEAYTGVAGIGVKVAADGVTISGLEISGYLWAVNPEDETDGLTLNDVSISESVFGIYKDFGDGVTDLAVNGGSFSDIYIGIYSGKGGPGDGGDLNGLTVDGVTFDHLGEKGMYFETLLNGLFTDITMNDVGTFGRGLPFTGTAGGENGTGIEFNLKYETGLYTNIVIDGFDFTDVGQSTGSTGTPHGNAGAITIKVRDDAPSYSGTPADFTGVVVIRDGSINGTSVGIRQGEGGKVVGGPSVAVENVTITDASVGQFENLTTAPMSVTLTSGDDVAAATAASSGPITIYAGDGADTLTGGANMTLVGGAGGDVYIMDNGGTIVEAAGEGFDEVRTSSASYTLTAGNVEGLTGTNAAGQSLTGNGENNLIQGAGGADTFAGAGGNDTYVVGAGDVVVEAAGQGVDTVLTDLDTYTLGANVEHLTYTGSGDFSGTGNAENNIITGGDGADVLQGLDGDDRLDGGLGADLMTGGKGDDTYYVDDGDVVFESSNSGRDTVHTALAAYTLTSNVEDLIGLSGTGQTLTGNGLANIITAGAGADILIGGLGDDVLRGGLGDDRLQGDGGSDTADYSRAVGGVQVNLLDTGSQNTGASGRDTLVSIENIWGSDFADSLFGDGGDNVLRGNNGNDVISARNGNDSVYGGLGDDNLTGGGGRDFLFGEDGADTIYGEAGDDVMEGGIGDDSLIAGDGADSLKGGDGVDRLYGDAGADYVEGGAGADVLRGGAGADMFWFDDGHLMANGGAIDRIYDFNAAEGDVIDLSAFDANANVGGDQAFVKVGAFTGTAGEFVLETAANGKYQTALFDTNGDGQADFALRIDGISDGVTGWML